MVIRWYWGDVGFFLRFLVLIINIIKNRFKKKFKIILLVFKKKMLEKGNCKL